MQRRELGAGAGVVLAFLLAVGCTVTEPSLISELGEPVDDVPVAVQPPVNPDEDLGSPGGRDGFGRRK